VEQSLCVHIAAEVLPGPIRITAEGHLTGDNYQALLDAVAPALILDDCPSITIDLTAVTHVEPSGLQRLEDYISTYQNEKKSPILKIVGLNVDAGSPKRSQDRVSDEIAPVDNTTVREVLSPIGPTVLASHSLGQAAHEISVWGEPVVVMDVSDQPLGVITEDDLDSIALDDAATLVALDDTAEFGNTTDWRKMPCSRLVEAPQHVLRAEDPIERVLAHYQQHEVYPLLVFDGQHAVGIVHPGSVYEWCAEHDPGALDTLLDQPVAEGVPPVATPSSTKF
jgi:hypothetical protein